MRAYMVFLLLAPAAAIAELRSGGPYAAILEAHSAGGGSSASASYKAYTTLAPVAGTGSSGPSARVNRGGFAGQIMQPASLALAATPATVAEAGTRAVTASAVMDDATTLALAPGEPAWSVSHGPLISVSTAGVVTAGVVYTNTSAGVSATWQSLAGSLGLTVLDTNPDNFGLYAGDTVPDEWQVLHFGPANPGGHGGQDPDGDGQSNLFEYVAGVSPTNQLSRFIFNISSVPAQPAQASLTLTPHFPDRTYVVEGRTNLVAGAWAPVAGVTNNTGLVKTVLDPAVSGPRKYYQVRIHKP
jgi:hypothetical protein